MKPCPIALTIAGSDSSAGAGMQADLKTFQHFKTYGMCAVTSVVAETSETVRSLHPIPPTILQDQLSLLLGSYPIRAIKTGLLVSKAHVVAVAEILSEHPNIPLIIDPVMVASTGDTLLEQDAITAYRTRLFPLATLITPNLDEAEVLAGRNLRSEDAITGAATQLSAEFGTNLLLKGGHLGEPECADLLCTREGQLTWFRSPRLDTPASHGTGCTLSAAITAHLAHGHSLNEAVGHAKTYLNQTLTHSLKLGDHHHLNQGTDFHLG